jgi:2-polyprenyl-3-methyl-5-hydroxy-6-metoxy-1,4-benzoquinol methylase
MKNQTYDFLYESSTTNSRNANLGIIESDASAFEGSFKPEVFRGEDIINKLLTLKFDTVLDIGAGECKQSDFLKENGKSVYTCDYGKGHNSIDNDKYDYVGDFNTMSFDRQFDCTLASHILEHQLNPNIFLKKIISITKPDGYVTIIVPPRKPFLIGGHVSIWNAGLMLYHLILAGVDCSKECYIKQYDYNIGITLKMI